MSRFRALLALLALLLTTAAAALAAAPADAASVVVQGREPGSDFSGKDLIAHRYEAPATGVETLTVVTPVTPAHEPHTWSTITTLDFDRDGIADAMVRLYGPGPVTYQVLRLERGASVPSLDREHDTCVIPDTLHGVASVVPAGGGTVGIATRAGSRAVSVSVSFDTWFGGIARYQPIMTTMWTPAASSLGNQLPVDDYLPKAAGPAAGSRPAIDNACRGMVTPTTQAWGFVLDQAKGDDREIPSGEVPTDQPMPDRQEMTTGESDLVKATVDQYIANRYATDLTADVPNVSGGQPTFNPADLTLSFAPGGGRASATYLTTITGTSAPFALLRTSAGSDADHITVQMQPGLSGLDFDGSGAGQCFPRNAATRLTGGSAWGATPVTMELPVTRDAQGRMSVRVALDRVLGVFAGNAATNRTKFAWLATTLPGAGGDPDYAPDFAGQDYTSKYAACTFTGADGASAGTVINPSLIPMMRGAAVDAQLALSPPAPQRDEQVTFTATPAVSGAFTQYFYDLNNDGLADTLDDGIIHTATRTKSFQTRTPATVVVRGADGVYGVALVDVQPADPPPVPRFTASAPAPYTLGPAGASIDWADDGSSDDGTIDARSWSLTRGSETIAGDGPEFHAPDFHYTFSEGQAGHWTLAYTLTDNEGVSATATQEFDVLAGDGGPGTGPTSAAIALAFPAGRIFAKRSLTFSAARSSVRVGPAHFTWDLDGDGSFEIDTGRQAFVTTTYATGGHRDVRVRLSDGDGATSISSPLGLDVAPAVDQPPTVVLNAPESVTLNGSSVSAALDATGSTGRNEDPSLTFAWDLDGDGIFETSTGATTHATATFTTPGDHVVRLRATDVYGNRAEAARTIFVRGSAEIANNCVGREQFRTVTYGPARVTSCWTKVDRPSAGPLWIARGDVGLNGLRLTGAEASARRAAASATARWPARPCRTPSTAVRRACGSRSTPATAR